MDDDSFAHLEDGGGLQHLGHEGRNALLRCVPCIVVVCRCVFVGWSLYVCMCKNVRVCYNMHTIDVCVYENVRGRMCSNIHHTIKQFCH